MSNNIYFFTEDINFNLKHRNAIRQWIKNIVAAEEKKIDSINYIFCSDNYLFKLNIDYLKHNTLTDVITFNYSEDNINGDVFISIERIKENAKIFKQKFYIELLRVIVHGTLHLCGYKDKSKKDKHLMQSKEDFYLSKLDFSIL